MKEILQQYASYNVWASMKLFEVIQQLTEEQIHQELSSSFSSIYKTILHLWDAESIWWQRLKLQEQIDVPSKIFSGNYAELEKRSMQQSKQWEEWVLNANDVHLLHVFGYQNTRKEQFKQPVNEVLIHIFNHGTYHRGQLVNMLRQLGIEKIPPTDFIVYSRSKK